MLENEGLERAVDTAPKPAKRTMPSLRICDKRSAAADLSYSCAHSLEEVEMAWQLVYERYVQKKLINENPLCLHTVPMAVGEHACVIRGPGGLGSDRHETRSTMTMIGDNPKGLPLDSVYRKQLDELRDAGRRPVEVGLLADRRRLASRSAVALFSMMRWAAYYVVHMGYTDIVIGVHPRHACFYMRCFGYQKLAPPARYPLVRDNPVIPLCLPVHDTLANHKSGGATYARENPLPASAFSGRFRFQPEQLHGSLIERFLSAPFGHVPRPVVEEVPPVREAATVSPLDEALADLPANPGLAF